MKTFVKWLAKVFNVNTVVEKVIVKEIVEYRYLTQGTIDGNVNIDGDLFVNGKLFVNGGISFYRKEE